MRRTLIAALAALAVPPAAVDAKPAPARVLTQAKAATRRMWWVIWVQAEHAPTPPLTVVCKGPVHQITCEVAGHPNNGATGTLVATNRYWYAHGKLVLISNQGGQALAY
jgi:hypothetical protein